MARPKKGTEEAKKKDHRGYLFLAAFFTGFLFLLYQAYRLVAPFAPALLWAGILAFALYPLFRRLRNSLGERAGLASLLMTLFTMILVIGPTVFLLVSLSNQLLDLYHQTGHYIESGEWNSLQRRVLAALPGKFEDGSLLQGLDLRTTIMKTLQDASARMASQVGHALKNAASVVAHFLIMVLSLFFFFRDGEHYYRLVYEIIPLPERQKEHIAAKLSDTLSAVVYGVLFISLLQGIMTGIGFALAGLSFSVFWGFLAFVLALIPVLGAAAVWIPGVAYLLLEGEPWRALFLSLWGLLLVSTPDNFLKPIFIGRKAKLPVFSLFIGILGGIKVYGILGILIGPLVVALVTTFVQIYQEEYTPGK